MFLKRDLVAALDQLPDDAILSFRVFNTDVDLHPQSVLRANVGEPVLATIFLVALDDEPSILAEDLRVDVYRNGGTKTRITHLPSGIVVEDEDGQSEIQQRDRAIRELRRRLSKETGWLADVETTPMERDGDFIPVKRIEDPKRLVPGNQLVHMASLRVSMILCRKDDGSGWWLVDDGGLADRVLTSGMWKLIPAEPHP